MSAGGDFGVILDGAEDLDEDEGTLEAVGLISISRSRNRWSDRESSRRILKLEIRGFRRREDSA